jgi:hypothetical protein
VRVRLFLPQGHESVAETAFRLGNVPAATSDVVAAEHGDATTNGEA